MPEESMGRNILLHGDVIEQLRALELETVDCVMTSPPYWGLRDYQLPPTVWDAKDGCGHEWGDHLTHRQRGSLHGANAQVGNTVSGVAGVEVQQGQFCQVCTAWRGCLGQEPTPDMFVAHLVAVFREVRRVLKDTGTVWLNLGDSYATQSPIRERNQFGYGTRPANHPLTPQPSSIGLKSLDLCNIPHRVASALQADGWYWRSTIIWAKRNAMPESVNGTRWEQGEDGLVLRRGSGRPTTAHEYVFLLTKTSNYYYDTEAIREKPVPHAPDKIPTTRKQPYFGQPSQRTTETGYTPHYEPPEQGRNKRSVWTLATEPSSDAHFATFPQALVETCILAGTSAKGVCRECGSPWARVIDHEGQWRPTCSHWSQQPEPATVLDPFAGTFTTSVVANRLGRNSIGIELNPEYIEMARNRLRQGSMVLEI